MLRSHDIFFYQIAETLTEGIVYLMVLFSPWAFGTTQEWSIWTMNIAGYGLGGLLAFKLAIRWFKGYHPPRWEREELRIANCEGRGQRTEVRLMSTRNLTRTLAVLTFLILAYCLVSALNAQANYSWQEQRFDYLDHIAWLPASFHRSRTWHYFWNYLALACSFWAIRDWLLGRSLTEERALHRTGPGAVAGFSSSAPSLLPARLRRLLWVLCINGGLLAAEAIVQRLSHTPKLLWLEMTTMNKEALAQLGPFAYRSNGAQYLNLLWPVCVGFWWTLQGRRRSRAGGHHLLLVCAAVMAAGPIISTSRGGAVVDVGMMGLAAVIFGALHFLFPGSRRLPSHEPCPPSGVSAGTVAKLHNSEGGVTRRPEFPRIFEDGDSRSSPLRGVLRQSPAERRHLEERRKNAALCRDPATPSSMAHPVGTDSTRSPSDSRARRFASSSALALLLFLAVALGLGFGFGWKSLVPRMSEINFEEGLDMRLKLSEAGMAMAKDHPLFGTGPGTFASVCLLYPSPFPKSPWVFQLHDDWVETLITFGGVGSALIALAFLAVLAHWFARGGICTGCRFVILLWLAMAGCLVHAKVDFPFQIYSILFLFLIFCAMLSILSRRPGRA